jgi:hypothetical protein
VRFSIVLLPGEVIQVSSIGIQSGVWTAKNLAFKLGAVVTLIQPLFIAFLYLVSSTPIRQGIPEQQIMAMVSQEDDIV